MFGSPNGRFRTSPRWPWSSVPPDGRPLPGDPRAIVTVDVPMTTTRISTSASLHQSKVDSNVCRRLGSRHRRVIGAVTVLGFALPIVMYVWFIQHYGSNVIGADQWSDVNVLGSAYAGKLSLPALWAQHNENRMLFPNLLVVVQGYTTHLNLVVEMYLGAIMLFGATFFIIVTHRRRSVAIPWIAYCPVALLMLSFVQYGNTLWGFQMAWYLILLCLGISLFLLDRPTLTWIWLAGAVAAAIVGSFSSLQGLFIWPAGLVLLAFRRRPKRFMLAWLGAGLGTTAVYFYRFNPTLGSDNHAFAIEHPIGSLTYFLTAIGDVLGQPLHSDKTNPVLLLIGLACVVVVIVAAVRTFHLHDPDSPAPIGLALVCFGLLFAASITEGRSFLGLSDAATTRYATCDLLVLVGAYLALLGSPRRETRSVGRGRSVLRATSIVLATIIGAQLVLGTINGIAGARAMHQRYPYAADVLVNIDKASNPVVQQALYSFQRPEFIRQMARIARAHRLSLFDTGAVAQYTKVGLDPGLSAGR